MEFFHEEFDEAAADVMAEAAVIELLRTGSCRPEMVLSFWA